MRAHNYKTTMTSEKNKTTRAQVSCFDPLTQLPVQERQGGREQRQHKEVGSGHYGVGGDWMIYLGVFGIQWQGQGATRHNSQEF